jgi:hypothetical protein
VTDRTHAASERALVLRDDLAIDNCVCGLGNHGVRTTLISKIITVVRRCVD